MARKKLLKIIALVLSISLFTTGCWDSLDINDRVIVTATLVDKTTDGYEFYTEIPSIKEKSTSQEAKSVVVKSEGNSLTNARENLERTLDSPIYLGAVQSVLVTDQFASFGIGEYMMRIREINEYRKTVPIIVTPDDPEKLLGSESETGEAVGFAIDDTIQSLVNTGQLYHISLNDVLESLASPYKHFVLPTIALVDNQPSFIGFTVLSGGIKTGFIPADECKSIIFMNAPNNKETYVIPYNGKYITIDVQVAKKKIKPNYSEGKVSINVDLKFSATLRYQEDGRTVTKDDLAVIDKILQAMLENEFKNEFKKSQETYQYDIYNLHEYFRIFYPEAFKRMNWAEQYNTVQTNFSIMVDLKVADMMDYDPQQ